jgi:hypothetical protein
MTMLRVVVARLAGFLSMWRRETELNDEIQAHLDLLAEEHLRRGLSLAEARAAARREFGGVEQIKEVCRDHRGLPLVDTAVQDLRYASRMLRKDPAFTTVVVATLSIGIAAASLAFTLVYVPFPVPGTTPFATFAVRAAGDSQLLVEPLRRLMADTRAQVDGDVMTGVAYREREWRRERMLSGFLVFFGVLALGISCLGVYGILEYIVSLRTPELGIRMALGADRPAVVRLVLAESVVPVAIGMGLGLTGALILTRWLESVLFGVSPHDPWSIAGAATLLLLTAAAAAFVPARRAALTDPMTALRQE